jgi:hypothetical protein
MLSLARPYLILVVLLSLLATGPYAQAQLCGGGARRLELYLPYGQLADSLHYEVTLLNKAERGTILQSVDTSTPLECAAWLVAPAVARQTLSARQPHALIQPVSQGKIEVPTGPHSDYPTIIHIFSTRAEAYVFSTFFCGCRNTPIRLIWGLRPQLMQGR